MNRGKLYLSKTKRRRVIKLKVGIILFSFLLVLLINFFVGSFSTNAHGNSLEESIEYKYYKSIEIQQGDSLWSIAEDYTDGSISSIINYVKELKTLNSLSTDQIHAGNYLTVVYYKNEFIK